MGSGTICPRFPNTRCPYASYSPTAQGLLIVAAGIAALVLVVLMAQAAIRGKCPRPEGERLDIHAPAMLAQAVGFVLLIMAAVMYLRGR